MSSGHCSVGTLISSMRGLIELHSLCRILTVTASRVLSPAAAHCDSRPHFCAELSAYQFDVRLVYTVCYTHCMVHTVWYNVDAWNSIHWGTHFTILLSLRHSGRLSSWSVKQMCVSPAHIWTPGRKRRKREREQEEARGIAVRSRPDLGQLIDW